MSVGHPNRPGKCQPSGHSLCQGWHSPGEHEERGLWEKPDEVASVEGVLGVVRVGRGEGGRESDGSRTD